MTNSDIGTKQKAACLVCGGEVEVTIRNIHDTRFGVNGEYDIGKCLACGLEQITPALSHHELKSLYEKYYNFGGKKGTFYTRIRKLFFDSVIYRIWLIIDGDTSFHSYKGSGRLLDFGCNEGRNLAFFKKNGYQAEGLELNDKAAEVARSLGFTVHSELAEGMRPEKPYDVVVMSNVIEHLLNSRGALTNIHRVLSSGGQVWISCPNADSWLRSVFGRSWINWHPPFHIAHFSKDSLCRLLETSGFKIEKMIYKTPALWVTHSFITLLFAEPVRPTKQLQNPFLVASLMLLIRGFLFPILFLGNYLGRGDCLIITAKSF